VDSNKVEIFGRYYTVGGSKDAAYLQELAAMLDRKMRQIAAETGTVDTLKTAILAALNIADCQIRDQEEHTKADIELERKLTALSEQIDMVLST